MPSDSTSAPDVVVVGAGLAGLAAARRLTDARRTVSVLERSDAPGGRMRTDLVDGFRIDRGFQVLNTAYPELRRTGLLDRLALQRFTRGALLAGGGRQRRLADPRQDPGSLLSDATIPLGSVRERVTLAAFLAECGYASPRRIKRRADVEFVRQLRSWRLDGAVTDRFIRPFLAGVLLEDDLTTSARFVDLVWRTFVRGEVVVPAGGMQALPDALAASLPDATIRYGVEVTAVRPRAVDTTAGTVEAGAVIVAADPVRAANLVGLPTPAMHAVTTVWQAADVAPVDEPIIALDSEGGPLVNSVVLSNAAPGYSPDGRALVATSYLGTEPLPTETFERALTRLWVTDTRGWQPVTTSVVREALPALPGGSPLRKPVRLPGGVFVAGDWRDTPSTQGALVSGRRAADAVLAGPQTGTS